MSRAPQQCPNPECKVSLRDRSVPARFKKYRRQFTLATIPGDAPVEPGRTWWQCPSCRHRWTTGGMTAGVVPT